MSDQRIVLIFSASTGGGHNLAAQTIQKGLEGRGYDARIIDTFEQSSRTLNKMITGGYRRMVENTPKFYDLLYRQFDKMTPFQRAIFHIGTSIISPEILSMILNDSPVLLISTHPFVTNVLGRLKGMGAFHTPVLSFITDYKFHGVYRSQNVDAYVVGSDYTKQDMIERGIAPDIIYPYGIPVRAAFNEKGSSKTPKDKNIKGTVLLMGGSLGTGRIEPAFRNLILTKAPIHLMVVCGHNEEMRAKLAQIPYDTLKGNAHTRVDIFGYVENISELMDSSDIIVSKPGGLTTTEAMLKGTPMIIPYTYPGQEEENAKFLEKTGMGILVKDIAELPKLVDLLMEHKNIADEISDNMNEAAKNYSPEKTLDLCEKLIDRYVHGTSENSDK